MKLLVSAYNKFISYLTFYSVLSFVLLNSSFYAYAVDSSIEKSIKENTFIFIPINLYASPMPKENAEEFVKKNCQMSHLPPSEVLNCKALSQCQDQDCIREYESHGTAFLLENGKQLFTAWHVTFPTHAAALYFVKNHALTLDEEGRKNLFDGLVPRFLLLDHDHNIVYDSRLEHQTRYMNFGDPLSTIFVQEGRIKDDTYGHFENIPEDHVQIELTRSLGTGLIKSRDQVTSLDEELITTGFGYDSYNFNFLISTGHPNTLNHLKLQSGLYMNFLLNPMSMSEEDFLNLTQVEQLIIMGYSEESAEGQILEYGETLIDSSIRTVLGVHARHERDNLVEKDKHVLFLTNPVLPGQSGGPVLNFKGEVLGIITNSILEKDQNTSLYRSHGAGMYLFNPKSLN